MLKKVLALTIALVCFVGLNRICTNVEAEGPKMTFVLDGKKSGEQSKISVKLKNNSGEPVEKINGIQLAIKYEAAEYNDVKYSLSNFDSSFNADGNNETRTLLFIGGSLDLEAGKEVELATVIFEGAAAKFSVVEDPIVSIGSSVFCSDIVECDFTEIKFESEIVEASGVKLDKESLELEEGETAELKATVEPENATEKEVKWTSSDDSVATVTDGIVTAVKAGKATIKALCGEKEATAEIEVLAKETPEPTPDPEPEQKPESTPKDETGTKVEATVTVPENKEETTEEKSEPSNNETVVTSSSKQISTGENEKNIIGLGVLMVMAAGVLLNEKKRKSK